MGGRIAVATDTNSGIMYGGAERLGVSVVSMPFSIDGQECFEGVDLDVERFYRCQRDGSDIVTSQPSIAALGKLWKELLQEHDEVVYIPMSSGLSGSCETACRLAEHFEGRVFVVDNQRISVTQRESVLDALAWVREGRSAAEVRDLLEADALEASIYLMVDTMEHLRRGGRVTPAAAAIGSVLRIKPVLQIQGSKLDAFSVAKSERMARRTMLRAIARDVDERFGGSRNVHLYVAHTNCAETAREFAAEAGALFGGQDVYVDALPLSIACHVGAGALGVGCARRRRV